MSVCKMITFESLNRHIRVSGTSQESTGQVRISRSLGQGHGQTNKKGDNCYSQCNTSIGNDSGSVKHTIDP